MANYTDLKGLRATLIGRDTVQLNKDSLNNAVTLIDELIEYREAERKRLDEDREPGHNDKVITVSFYDSRSIADVEYLHYKQDEDDTYARCATVYSLRFKKKWYESELTFMDRVHDEGVRLVKRVGEDLLAHKRIFVTD